MQENRFSKYLLYALGEILLVVIGILLALQINSWNDNKKDRRLEANVMQELKEEFSQNAELIALRIAETDVSSQACLATMRLMESEEVMADTRSIDSLLYLTIEYKTFNPSTNTLEEIYQTGNFKILTNKELKSKLFEWTSEFQNYKDTYTIYTGYIEEHILPYYTQNIALKNIDKFSPMQWKKDSRFDSGMDFILNDRQFESLIDNNLYHLSRLKEDYLRLRDIIREIVDQTNKPG